MLHKYVAVPYISVHCIVVIINLLIFEKVSFSPSFTAAAAAAAAAADYDDNVTAFATIGIYPATMPVCSQIHESNKQYISSVGCVECYLQKNVSILQSAFHVQTREL